MIRFLFLIIVLVVWVSLFGNPFDENGGSRRERDTSSLIDVDDTLKHVSSTERAANMRKIQTALEIYMIENGSYPPVGESCGSAERLREYLVPNYLGKIPRGDLNVSVSDDGYQYVLQAEVSPTSVILLGRDEDKKVLGCQCADPFLCFKEYEEDLDEFYEKYGEYPQ